MYVCVYVGVGVGVCGAGGSACVGARVSLPVGGRCPWFLL